MAHLPCTCRAILAFFRRHVVVTCLLRLLGSRWGWPPVPSVSRQTKISMASKRERCVWILFHFPASKKERLKNDGWGDEEKQLVAKTYRSEPEDIDRQRRNSTFVSKQSTNWFWIQLQFCFVIRPASFPFPKKSRSTWKKQNKTERK